MNPGYAKRVEGFGLDFKAPRARTDPAMVSLAGFGEMLPNYDNYCEIDPGGLKDRYGIHSCDSMPGGAKTAEDGGGDVR